VTDSAKLDHTVTAPIQKDGAVPTCLVVPHSAEVLGTRRPVEVSGTADGHEFAATLMPSGTGPHRLPLSTAVCEAIGTRDAGDQVTVHLQHRLS
jgi:hypothetical protein